MYLEEKIKDALLEAVYITRWRKDGKTQYALLNTIELKQTVDNIIDELDEAGFKIVKKTNTKSKPIKNDKTKKAKRSFSDHRPIKIQV